MEKQNEAKLVKIQLSAFVECPRCFGKANIQHPVWERYWSHWKDEGKQLPYEKFRLWWDAQGFESPPPEKIKCFHCNGKGEIEVILYTQAVVGMYNIDPNRI
jgi:RecJ-like exonuclease